MWKGTTTNSSTTDLLANKREWRDMLRETWAMAQRLTKGRYGDSTQLADAYWRTLIGDLTMEGDHPAPPSWADYDECMKHILEFDTDAFSGADDVPSPSVDEDTLIKSATFGLVVAARGNFRRFCFTDGGYMGWVPQLSQPGDIVVLLLGARVPFVLRLVGVSAKGKSTEGEL